MTQYHDLEKDGVVYRWDGKTWFDLRTHQIPPRALTQTLNAELQTILAEQDDRTADFDTLLDHAKAAARAGQMTRAERLVRKALEIQPGHGGAAAVLSSVLRQRRAPDRALQETEHCRDPRNLPLLTSRAAAYCDLGRWEEAKREIAPVLAQGDADGALAVVRRIKAARPDLYEE